MITEENGITSTKASMYLHEYVKEARKVDFALNELYKAVQRFAFFSHRTFERAFEIVMPSSWEDFGEAKRLETWIYSNPEVLREVNSRAKLENILSDVKKLLISRKITKKSLLKAGFSEHLVAVIWGGVK